MVRRNRTAAATGFGRRRVSNYSAADSRIIRDGDIRRTRKRTRAAATNARTRKDGNRVYSHAARISTGVIGSMPSELRILTIRGWRQIDRGGNVAAGTPGPGRLTGKDAIGSTDGAVIASFHKTTAGGNDFDERTAIDTDLQPTAVETGFRVVVVSKRQPY